MSGDQLELHCPALPGDSPLIPARMVKEFVYYPRLAYPMWTPSEWAETGDTVEGKRANGRIDWRGAPLPASEALQSEDAAAATRSSADH